MYNEIREHVERRFAAAPRTPRAYELQEELISNLYEKYEDLLSKGETPESAFAITISGIGNIDDLIHELQKSSEFDPSYREMQQQKSALYLSVGIALIIASAIFPIIFGYFGATVSPFFIVMGFVLMLLCIAAGVGLLVYNHKMKADMHSQPAPSAFYSEKTDSSEQKYADCSPEFDSSSHKDPEHTLPPAYKSIQHIIYVGAVPLYLILGLFFNLWHPGWLVFLLAPLLAQIVHFAYLFSREESWK